MEIRPIRTKTDYRAALKEIETLMSARTGTHRDHEVLFTDRAEIELGRCRRMQGCTGGEE